MPLSKNRGPLLTSAANTTRNSTAKLTGLLQSAVDRLVQAIDSGDTVLVRAKAAAHEERHRLPSGPGPGRG